MQQLILNKFHMTQIGLFSLHFPVPVTVQQWPIGTHTRFVLLLFSKLKIKLIKIYENIFRFFGNLR